MQAAIRHMKPRAVWAGLEADTRARLVDVRTRAEWAFVGLPDLRALGREPILVEWQRFPDMAHNTDFVAETGAALAASGASPADPVYLLCRSGGRSAAAAAALTEAGYTQAINVAEGFEGDPDGHGHRGNTGGWKAAGLPWQQG